MKTQFTPGPWVAHHYGIRDRGGYICELRWPQHYEGQDARFEQETAEREGDARLIAAAPDLLTQLQAARDLVFVLSKHSNDKILEAHVQQYDAAIAKATQS